jgi:hypothetical protein
MWSRVDPNELARQVSEYHALKIYQAARGLSVLFLAFSATIEGMLLSLGVLETSAVLDIMAFFVLATFIAFGHRWAMVCAMVLWTAEKGVQIYQLLAQAAIAVPSFRNSAIAVSVLIWWAIYMHAFWLAYRVEQRRRRAA